MPPVLQAIRAAHLQPSRTPGSIVTHPAASHFPHLPAHPTVHITHTHTSTNATVLCRATEDDIVDFFSQCGTVVDVVRRTNQEGEPRLAAGCRHPGAQERAAPRLVPAQPRPGQSRVRHLSQPAILAMFPTRGCRQRIPCVQLCCVSIVAGAALPCPDPPQESSTPSATCNLTRWRRWSVPASSRGHVSAPGRGRLPSPQERPASLAPGPLPSSLPDWLLGARGCAHCRARAALLLSLPSTRGSLGDSGSESPLRRRPTCPQSCWAARFTLMRPPAARRVRRARSSPWRAAGSA